jgi:microcystin-dependent protein
MDPIIGQIILWSGLRIPSGWMLCDGRSLPIVSNQALFSIIGTTYGGNGTTNFNLPDLRSKVPLGVDSNVPNQGGAPGKTTGAATASGTATGAGTITIGVNNLPAHAHGATFTPGTAAPGTASVEVKIPAINQAGTTAVQAPNETTILGASAATTTKIYNTGAANINLLPFQATGTATVPAGTGTVTIANTGNGQPLQVSTTGPVSVSTIQPSLFLNYIIAIQGIYPTYD